MIPDPERCYKNMITLQLIMEKLYPNTNIIEIRDAFSEAVFSGVIDKERIDAIKRNSNKSAFYNATPRPDKGKYKLHVAKTVNAFRNALTSQEQCRRTYTQLIRNCKAILSDAENHGTHITAELFDFITVKNTYSEKLYLLIQECIARNRLDSALALTIIIAVFQETTHRAISVNSELTKLLTETVYEKSLEISAVYKVCADALKQAASEQGRMIAFNNVKHKMKIPEISSFCCDSFPHESCSLMSLFQDPPYENILLIGCGGSGKTFALIDLGKKLIERKDRILPFFIPLHILNSKSADDKTPILSCFMDALASRCDASHETVIDYLRSHSETIVLFLLDGYNDLTTHSVKLNIIAEILRLKREFKSIRFVITGRHDNSETFATGGELPFRTKWILPPNEKSIKQFLYKETATDSFFFQLKSHSKSFTDILSNPMALTMYAYASAADKSSLSNPDFNLSLPFSEPETMGEILRNFTEQIKCTHALKGTPQIQSRTETVAKIMYYIAFKMHVLNKHKLTQQELKLFFAEAVQKYNTYESAEISIDFYDRFMSNTRSMGFFICSRASEWQYRFYYQAFISCFSAHYLLYTIQSAISLYQSKKDIALELLCDAFGSDISDEVLKITGEIALEHHFLPEYNRDSQELSVIEQGLRILQGKHSEQAAHRSVKALIRAACLVRKNDMSTFHFDGLDLTGVSLNGVSLYSVHDGRIFTASFHGAYLSESTFMPNGHMAAVHTFVRIKEHILSIAADAIWSYDTKTRSHKLVTSCNGTYITVSAYSEKHRLLFTGDKNGWVRTWKCDEDASGNISLTECSELAFSRPDIIRQILIDEERDLCIIGVKGNDICQFPIKYPEQRRYIQLCEKIRNTPKYKFLLVGDCLYLASGLAVYKAHKGVSEITEDNIFMNLEYDEDSDYIYDFKYLHTALDEYFIFNIRGSVSSAVKAASGKNCRTIKKVQHTLDWNGFNAISVSDYDSCFCICNNTDSSEHPAVTVVTYNTFRNDFVCHDYYGIQNMEIFDCCFVNRDEVMLSSIDRSMQIINTRTESITARFPGYNPGIRNMHIYNPDTILACTYDGAFLRLQRSHADEKWHCMQNKAAHDGWANEICGFSHDNALYAAVCGNDGNVSIWNMETEERIIAINSDSSITSVCHLFGEYILASSRTGKIMIYKLDVENRAYTVAHSFCPRKQSAKSYLHFHAHLISADTASASLLILSASASKNSRIYRMDIQNGTELSVKINELFSWKNTIIRTLSSVFSTERNQNIYVAAGTRYLPDEAEYVAVFSDDTLIAEVLNERDSEYKKLRCDTMAENTGFLSGTFFAHNGKLYIATASYSHMLHIYGLDDGKLTEITTVHIGFPSVDTKFSNGSLYMTSLSGKLLEIPVEHVISGGIQADLWDYTVFQNVSGLYLNHVDLSDCHCDFGDGFREIIRRYQARL